jgi:hypothetical protein
MNVIVSASSDVNIKRIIGRINFRSGLRPYEALDRYGGALGFFPDKEAARDAILAANAPSTGGGAG